MNTTFGNTLSNEIRRVVLRRSRSEELAMLYPCCEIRMVNGEVIRAVDAMQDQWNDPYGGHSAAYWAHVASHTLSHEDWVDKTFYRDGDHYPGGDA